MTKIGTPEEIPEIEVQPLEDPVPRIEPRPVPVEPELPVVDPVEDPVLVPA